MRDKGYLKGDNALKAKIKTNDDVPWWERIKDSTLDDVKGKKPEVEYNAGAGNHFFLWKNTRIWFHYDEGKIFQVGWEKKPMANSTISLTAFGQDPAILKDFIDSCVVYSMEVDDGRIGIYELHQWGIGWNKAQTKKARDIDSVVLDKDLSEELIADIKNFQDSADWYRSKGVPYRRGYLLYGPPGTGKTSFTQAIAGALNLNICYLNLSGGRLDDDGLNRALNDAPPSSIILLEDIDGIFVERSAVEKKKRRRAVTFSGLLNALDGVRSQEGRVLFMTTNHREKLDPAILRPGRADYQVKLNYASHV